MSAHRCRPVKTPDAARLEAVDLVLDQPLSMARGKYSLERLRAFDVEADEIRARLSAEGRCAGCGAVVSLPTVVVPVGSQ